MNARVFAAAAAKAAPGGYNLTVASTITHLAMEMLKHASGG